ncbi:hypothetical protein B0J13DRAFT_664368 [Dactylonectria estremocensis]|uniref:Uncharacterized protein n=1 Tax=Dactylonectria estremocensis TaxID=1079267 RepID=A0A9P9J843_9HYPO|nr:hypothetical protein B0J13DRAFT_664368 [Dactylonectria estremocensis]
MIGGRGHCGGAVEPCSTGLGGSRTPTTRRRARGSYILHGDYYESDAGDGEDDNDNDERSQQSPELDRVERSKRCGGSFLLRSCLTMPNTVLLRALRTASGIMMATRMRMKLMESVDTNAVVPMGPWLASSAVAMGIPLANAQRTPHDRYQVIGRQHLCSARTRHTLHQTIQILGMILPHFRSAARSRGPPPVCCAMQQLVLSALVGEDRL